MLFTEAQKQSGASSAQIDFYPSTIRRQKEPVVDISIGWNKKTRVGSIPLKCYNFNPMLKAEQDSVKNLLQNYRMRQCHLELQGRYMNPPPSTELAHLNPNKRMVREKREVSLIAPYALEQQLCMN